MKTFVLRILISLTVSASPWLEMNSHEPTDSTFTTPTPGEYTFRARELILPGVLLTIGIGGYCLDGFYGFNDEANAGMTNLRSGHYLHVDDYLQYLPAATYLSFGAIGVKGKHPFKERVAVAATAYLTMAALTNVGKYTFCEKRPDSNARNSFPSGHTATAFTGAELMRIEYGTKLGIISYFVATGVSFLRLYNGRHWVNDVIAGAGIGILSARVGYWMLPLCRKWFGWNKPGCKTTLILSPQYDPGCRCCGLALLWSF